MKKLTSKITAITIAIFFVLSMTASISLIPNANAHTPPWTVPTYAYVTCAPQTVGVGQYTTIVAWLDLFSPNAGGITGQEWSGWVINITTPSGATDIIGPFTCDSALSSTFKIFTPTEVGTYKIVFSWPGGVIAPSESVPSAYPQSTGDIFEGSTSAPAYLTVQSTPVPSWPEPPVPTDYWTLPINSANRGWSTLASNWLKGTWLTNGLQEGTAPTSAHVLWTEPIIASSPSTAGYPGGIADAQWPDYPNDINDYKVHGQRR